MHVVGVLGRAKGALDAMDGDMRDRVVERLAGPGADPYSKKQLVSRMTRSARVGSHVIFFHICVADRKVVVPCMAKRGRTHDR